MQNHAHDAPRRCAHCFSDADFFGSVFYNDEHNVTHPHHSCNDAADAHKPNEKLDAFNQLSAYINHSIEEQESVWIAQAEGRAKDGNDKTDSAIIKMFHMSQKRGERSFSQVMNDLHIVPVAISYEWDPCDLDKANELYHK